MTEKRFKIFIDSNDRKSLWDDERTEEEPLIALNRFGEIYGIDDCCKLLNSLNDENEQLKTRNKKHQKHHKKPNGKRTNTTRLQQSKTSIRGNKMKPEYEIKGSLVIDRVNHRSYNMTSKIDAENLYTTLTNCQKTLKTYKNIDQKLDKVSKNIIHLPMTVSILQEEINHLKEAIQ